MENNFAMRTRRQCVQKLDAESTVLHSRNNGDAVLHSTSNGGKSGRKQVGFHSGKGVNRALVRSPGSEITFPGKKYETPTKRWKTSTILGIAILALGTQAVTSPLKDLDDAIKAVEDATPGTLNKAVSIKKLKHKWKLASEDEQMEYSENTTPERQKVIWEQELLTPAKENAIWETLSENDKITVDLKQYWMELPGTQEQIEYWNNLGTKEKKENLWNVLEQTEKTNLWKDLPDEQKEYLWVKILKQKEQTHFWNEVLTDDERSQMAERVSQDLLKLDLEELRGNELSYVVRDSKAYFNESHLELLRDEETKFQTAGGFETKIYKELNAMEQQSIWLQKNWDPLQFEGESMHNYELTWEELPGRFPEIEWELLNATVGEGDKKYGAKGYPYFEMQDLQEIAKGNIPGQAAGGSSQPMDTLHIVMFVVLGILGAILCGFIIVYLCALCDRRKG